MRTRGRETAGIFKRQDGFSLIELMIVMVVLIIVMGITMNTSSLIFKQSSHQARMAESQMERIAGVEMLKLDIEQAGYGLPWAFQNTIVYNEAASSPASNYNDSTAGVPRAVAGGSNLQNNYVLKNSDYLVIKSIISGMDTPSQKISYMTDPSTARIWNSTPDDLGSADNVIGIRPQASDTTFRQLLMNGSNFSTTFGVTGGYVPGLTVQAADLIYGLSPSGAVPRMPFNRADYYVRKPSSGIPTRCNGNTGVLYKATVNNNTGTSGGSLTEYPLLDCVAYMYVVLNLDMNDDGAPGTFSTLPDDVTNSLTISSPSEGASITNVQITLGSPDSLRKRLKEVRVFILVQDGQKDTGYTYPSQTIILGAGTGIPKNLDLAATVGTNWQNYRWKVITLVVKPKNLY